MVWLTELTDEERKRLRSTGRDVAYATLFVVALGFFVVGGILRSPADLGLIGSGMGILAVIGIAKA